jgi:uncharacterized protein YjbI with pentapeptide repeats
MKNFKDARPAARVGFTASLLLVSTLGPCSSATAETNFCSMICDRKNPPACSSGAGKGPVNLSEQTLTNLNFADKPHTYLVGANLSKTTLIGVNFSGLDLTNANFSGAQAQANNDGRRTDFTNTVLDGTCFTGADLGGADFQFATFKQTDFTCASLLTAKFGPIVAFEGDTTQRTKFNYSQVNIARSADSYFFPLDRMSEIATTTEPSFWTQTDFTCTRFNGLDKTNFKPAGRTMTSAILSGAVLDGFEFYNKETGKGVNLDYADLTGTSLRAAGLVSASLEGVKLVSADLTRADLTDAKFYKTGTIHSDLTLAVLNGSTLNQARLDHAVLSGAQLNEVQALNAHFEDSTLQATSSKSVALVIESDFSGATFTNAALNNVTFSRCTLNSAQMAKLTLSGTSFQDSTMIGAVFESAKLQDVNFTGAKLNNVSFVDAKLNAEKTGAGVNFTCAQLGGADFTSATLDKTNFNAAVMPPADQCCPQKVGFFCGSASGVAYGPTTLPAMTQTTSVTCPNGRTGGCSGVDWVIPGWKTSLCGGGERRPDRHGKDRRSEAGGLRAGCALLRSPPADHEGGSGDARISQLPGAGDRESRRLDEKQLSRPQDAGPQLKQTDRRGGLQAIFRESPVDQAVQ